MEYRKSLRSYYQWKNHLYLQHLWSLLHLVSYLSSMFHLSLVINVAEMVNQALFDHYRSWLLHHHYLYLTVHDQALWVHYFRVLIGIRFSSLPLVVWERIDCKYVLISSTYMSSLLCNRYRSSQLLWNSRLQVVCQSHQRKSNLQQSMPKMEASIRAWLCSVNFMSF